MDCAICMDEINKQTGVVTLSCEHSFHFYCIDEWFYKQLVDGNHQTCPCCRSEGTKLDRCAFEEVHEEDDDDDETYETESEDGSVDDGMPDFNEEIRWERVGPSQWMVTNSREMAYESLRNLFGPMNELEVQEETSQEVAARKIQAIFRGFKTRETFYAARALTVLVN